ncbi:hypothetical protein [Pseudomonas aeruginosa]|uniref:hypothetical protein n=1 Tax=Pseudomonas aeruginosa TaxID=287 RepID=UPI00295548DB|nr:hypothetical protein [Pseudomonas aeruginosa]MDV7876605.1 hypothetical protein [Pseudomonas aeruginosa]
MMVIVMLLAMLLAWAGHVIASVVGPEPQVPLTMETAHGHMHASEVADQPFEALYADHGHDHSVPDHLHETPHLTAKIKVAASPSTYFVRPSAHREPPSAPLALIERPPRPSALG